MVGCSFRTERDDIEVRIPLAVSSWEISLTGQDDDEYDHRAQRRRYEEPLAVTLRKQILSIAESVRASYAALH